MNDPLDKQVINSMLDHFICPAACKKDYEIPKSWFYLVFQHSYSPLTFINGIHKLNAVT